MNQLEERLARLEKYLEVLVSEVQELKLIAKKERFIQDGDEIENKAVKGYDGSEGQHNLLQIYKEGYHVCNLYFGNHRGGEECLFCSALLKRHHKGE